MRLLVIALGTAALLLTVRAEAGPADVGADGLWRTAADHGVVRVAPCGDALCGAIVSSDKLTADPALTDVRNQNPALRTRPLKGMPIFFGLKGGPPVWKGGSVYNPVDGRIYQGSITLVNADTLKLTGCVFYPLCQSQIWTRLR